MAADESVRHVPQVRGGAGMCARSAKKAETASGRGPGGGALRRCLSTGRRRPSGGGVRRHHADRPTCLRAGEWRVPTSSTRKTSGAHVKEPQDAQMGT